MRTPGSANELEYRRRLAVERVADGYSTQEVADFLGVDPSTVRRWRVGFRDRGDAGLVTKPVSGRPAKLTSTQEKVALRWLTDSDLPPWRITYWHFMPWSRDGTLQRLHDELRGDLRVAEGRQRQPSAAVLDSQSSKTTEKGGSGAMTPVRRSAAASGTSSWTSSA